MLRQVLHGLAAWQLQSRRYVNHQTVVLSDGSLVMEALAQSTPSNQTAMSSAKGTSVGSPVASTPSRQAVDKRQRDAAFPLVDGRGGRKRCQRGPRPMHRTSSGMPSRLTSVRGFLRIRA